MTEQWFDLTKTNIGQRVQLRAARYGDGQLALIAEPEDIYDGGSFERLSVNLIDHGFVAMPGTCYINSGGGDSTVLETLVDLGAVEKIERVTYGPFASQAWLVRVNEGALTP